MADRMTSERERLIREMRQDYRRSDIDLDDAVDDLLAEVDRLRGALREACAHVAEQDAKIGELSAQLHAARQQQPTVEDDPEPQTFARGRTAKEAMFRLMADTTPNTDNAEAFSRAADEEHRAAGGDR